MLNGHLLNLLQLADPTLPIGGYAHSAGLETYVQQGAVNDQKSALRFITHMLTQSLQYTDAAFAALAYAVAAENDVDELLRLDDECTAVKLPEEIRQASQKLGMRLMKIFQPLCNSVAGEQYLEAIRLQRAKGHYCIAFGLYAQTFQIDKASALTGFYYSAAAGMVTNAVKLIPLGQQDGQKILFSLQPLIQNLVRSTLDPDRALIGRCCPGFDIRCMQHEQLYSRLYMS